MLVVRDTGGEVRAFLNVCRHRGNRLCRADSGNAASFTCAYHGWTYGNDGRLTGVPYLKEAYHGELDRERWGLVPVAQLDQYKGLWFATFDPEAPPLREYLGEMAWYLDTFVDRREGGIEVVATHKWVMPCNWKFPAENFGGDAYHVPLEPLLGDATGFSVGSTAKPRQRQPHGVAGQRPCPDLHRRRHGYGDAPMPEIQAYERADPARGATQRLGPAGRSWSTRSSAPCFRISRCCAAPRGRCACGTRAAPTRPRSGRGSSSTRRRRPRSRGRSGWPACAASARAAPSSRTTWTIGRNAPRPAAASMSRRMPINNQMGLGHERFDAALGAWASDYRLQRKQPPPVLPALGRS